MKILIVGATGYLGQALAALLRTKSDDVTGLARSDVSAAKLTKAGIDVLMGDVSEPDTFLDGLAAFEAIVFMARTDIASEYAAVEAILEAVAYTAKKFIFISGSKVLCVKSAGEWVEASFAEDDPLPPPLEGSGERRQTENLVRSFASRGVVPLVIRSSMIWGGGRQQALAVVHASARTGAISYLGLGLNAVSTIHVDDMAELISLALERGEPGALYHAASGEHSWRAIAGEVARIRGLPLRSLSLTEAYEMFSKSFTDVVFGVSSRTRCPRAREELGWRASPDRLDFYAELAHPAYTLAG